MTSFDDLLKFSNTLSITKVEDVDPLAQEIWVALIEDYYRSIGEDSPLPKEPPGISMKKLYLPIKLG